MPIRHFANSDAALSPYCGAALDPVGVTWFTSIPDDVTCAACRAVMGRQITQLMTREGKARNG